MFSSKSSNTKIIEIAKNPSSLSLAALKSELSHFSDEINIQDRTHLNYTPLMWTVHNGQRKKMDLLLEHSANPYLITSQKSNLLHIAASRNHLAIYHYLATCFPLLTKMKNDEDLTPQQILNRVIHSCSTMVLHQEFLSLIKDPDCRHIDSINQLVENDSFNINFREFCDYENSKPFYYAYTPLMWAVHLGDFAKVKLLLHHKANPDLTTENGNTILHIAAKQGHADIYQYLAHYYFHLLYKRGENNMTPEELAWYYNQFSIVDIHKKHFSNPFFSSVKKIIPQELVAYIVGFIHEPAEIQNLSSINKSWHALLSEGDFKLLFANYVRSQLPKSLRELSWKSITSHYFPSAMDGLNKIEDEFGWLKEFIKLATTFYIIGNSISLGKIEEITIFSDYRGHGYYPDRPRTTQSFHGNNIPENEIKNNFNHLLRKNSFIQIYCLLRDALQDEYKKNPEVFIAQDEYYQRSPIFVHFRLQASPVYVVTIRTELALALLDSKSNQHIVKRDDIGSVKHYYLVKTDRHNWDKDFAVFPRKITPDKDETFVADKKRSNFSP